MDLQVTGKTALITGSTAGIGLAIARRLAAEGADVIVNGRTAARVEAAVAELRTPAAGGRMTRISGIAADCTTEAGLATLARQLPDVDILINNVGVYAAAPLAAVTGADFTAMFAVNVVTGARLALHYLPGMTARGWGRVVFIGSEAGANIPPDMLAYGVSKAAQAALARGLAETTAGTAVTVNSVLPGPTYSEGIGRFLESLDLGGAADREAGERAFLRTLRPTSLLQRFAAPEEVASLVAYLASPLSSATNGAALRAEGGILRQVL